MNYYPDELVRDPRPLVFTVGGIEGISNVDFKLHSILQQADSEQKPIIQYQSVSYDHEFPMKSQTYASRVVEGRFIAPLTTQEGILKNKWLRKHFYDLPSCVLLLEAFNVDITGTAWVSSENSIVNHFERNHARRLKKWEKMLNSAAHANLICRYNFRIGIFYQFIGSEDKTLRHLRLAYDTVIGIFTAGSLSMMTSLSRGLSSQGLDIGGLAIEAFGTAVDLICTGQLGSQLLTSEIEKLSQSMYVTWPNLWWPSQAATVAEWLNLRILQLLVRAGKITEASEQFHEFIYKFYMLPTIYPTTIPPGTPEVVWKLLLIYRQWSHCIWMSRHYVVFAEILDTSGVYQNDRNLGPAAPYLSQAYLYENASKWAIKRKEQFSEHFGNPALESDVRVTIGAKRLLAMASNILRLRTVIFEPPSFCGALNQVLISMPGLNERQNLKLSNPYHVVCVCLLKELGNEFNYSTSHHENVLRLLEESVTRVSSLSEDCMRRNNRLRWLMADSCIKSNQFLIARMYLLPLLGDASQGPPCEGWEEASYALSLMLKACDFGLGLSSEYFDCCVRIACLNVSLAVRRRNFLGAMLMLIMRQEGDHAVWIINDQSQVKQLTSLVDESVYLSRGFGKYADSAFVGSSSSPEQKLSAQSIKFQFLPRIIEVNLNIVSNSRGLHSAIISDGLPDGHVFRAIGKILKSFVSSQTSYEWTDKLKCVMGPDGKLSHVRVMISSNDAKLLLARRANDAEESKLIDPPTADQITAVFGSGNFIDILKNQFHDPWSIDQSAKLNHVAGCSASILCSLFFPFLCKVLDLKEHATVVSPTRTARPPKQTDSSLLALSSLACLPFFSPNNIESDKPMVMTFSKRLVSDDAVRPSTASLSPQSSLTTSKLKQPVSISSSFYAAKSIKRLSVTKRDSGHSQSIVPSGSSCAYHIITHQSNIKQGFDVYCWYSHHSWDGLFVKPLLNVGDVVTVTAILVSHFPTPVHFSRIEFQFSGDSIEAYLDDAELTGGSSVSKKRDNMFFNAPEYGQYPAIIVDRYSAFSSPPTWNSNKSTPSKFSCTISPVADLLFYPKQIRVIEFDLAITEELAVLGAHERDYILSLDRVKLHLNLTEELTRVNGALDMSGLRGPHVVFSISTNSCQATIALQMISPSEGDSPNEEAEVQETPRKSNAPRPSIVSTPSPMFRLAVTTTCPLSPMPYTRIKHAKPLAKMTFKMPSLKSSSNCLMKPATSTEARSNQHSELNLLAGVIHRVDLVVESMDDLVLNGEISISYAGLSEGGMSVDNVRQARPRYNTPVFWWPMCPMTKDPLLIMSSRDCHDFDKSECSLTKLSSLEFCPLKELDFDDRRNKKHHHHHKYSWKRQCASVFRLKNSLLPNSSIVIPIFVKLDSTLDNEQIAIQARLDYISSREYSKLKVSLVETVVVKLSKALHLTSELQTVRPNEMSSATASFSSLKSIYETRDDRLEPMDSRRFKGLKDVKLDKSLKSARTVCFSGQTVLCGISLDNVNQQQGRVQSVLVHSINLSNCSCPYFQLLSPTDLLKSNNGDCKSLILSYGGSYRSGYFIRCNISDVEGDKFVAESPGVIGVKWSPSCDDRHCKVNHDNFSLRLSHESTIDDLSINQIAHDNASTLLERKSCDDDDRSNSIDGCGGPNDCFSLLIKRQAGGPTQLVLFDRPVYKSALSSRNGLIQNDILWPLIEYPDFSMEYCEDVKLFEDSTCIVDKRTSLFWIAEQRSIMPLLCASSPAFIVRIQCYHANRKSLEINDTALTVVMDEPFNLSIVILNRVIEAGDLEEFGQEEEFSVTIQNTSPNFLMSGHDNRLVRIPYGRSRAFVDFKLFPLISGLISLPLVKVIWNRTGVTIAEFNGSSGQVRNILCLPKNI